MVNCIACFSAGVRPRPNLPVVSAFACSHVSTDSLKLTQSGRSVNGHRPRTLSSSPYSTNSLRRPPQADQEAAVKSSPPRFFPPALWLAEYRASWLRPDIIAGVTLAAYAIPVSLAYATLAGLPPQIGIYGYMLGGIGYALL